MRILILVTCLILAACGGEPRGETGDEPGEMASGSMPLIDDGVLPVIDVRVAWMRPHPTGRDITAAYFTLYLSEGGIDRLLSARIDGASQVQLHGHTIAENGLMQMRPIEAQDVVAGAPLIFAPGGRHLMVHGLAPASVGDEVAGVLVFERAGEIPVRFSVLDVPPAMNHAD